MSHLPNRDPACSLCTEPLKTPHEHSWTVGGARPGEVVVVRESIHAPIDHIFSQLSAESKDLRSSALDKTQWPGRPGVILGKRQIGPAKVATTFVQTTTLCLLTSYDGINQYRHLPEVLNHFAIPVSPHFEIRTGRSHVHMSPEWQESNKWFVAYPFISTGPIVGRWHWKNEQGSWQKKLSFKLDKSALAELINTCEGKLVEWTTRCKDPDYLRRTNDEYQVRTSSTLCIYEPVKGANCPRRSFGIERNGPRGWQQWIRMLSARRRRLQRKGWQAARRPLLRLQTASGVRRITYANYEPLSGH